MIFQGNNVNIVKKINKKLGKLATLARAKTMNNGVKAYWWSKELNFGDLFTQELFYHYDVTPIETPVAQADIIGTGSLFGMIPKDYEGVILGTGLISDTEDRYEKANFAAVRGHLTRQKLGLPQSTPVGDFGLLAIKLLKNRPVEKQYQVGLIPHYVDKAHPWIEEVKKKLGTNCLVIDVQNTATNVTKQVANCELIISSSLHGIIVADSLNIPNVWVELSDNVIGKGFKFWDYNSAIDYEQSPLVVNTGTTFADVENKISNKNSTTINNKIAEIDGIIVSVLNQYPIN